MYDRNPVQWLIGLMVTEAMLSSSAVTTEPTLLCTGYCRDMYCATLICPAGYEMMCQFSGCDEYIRGDECKKVGEGYVLRYLDDVTTCDNPDYAEVTCCICRAPAPPGPTVAPNETGIECWNGMCEMTLLCPPGYNLSQPHSFCAHHNCSVLGPNYVEESMDYGHNSLGMCNHEVVYERRCRTCELGPDSTGTSSSSIMPSTSSIMPSTSTTTTSSMDVQAYMCALEAIEIMGAGIGAVNGVYYKVPNRQNAEVGRTALTECELCATWQYGQWQVYVTNSNFWRISGTDPLSYYYDGVGYMMGPPKSGDWDDKMEKNGTKPDPVVLPARMFVPITGQEEACRGATATDNSDSYYELVAASSLEECQDRCLSQPRHCKGIEFGRGRCEIWTRPEGILSSYKLTGFTCLRNDLAPVFSPMDGGKDRACRGATSLDNSASYYKLFKGLTLGDCRSKCMDEPLCKGIEHATEYWHAGRCEIWTLSHGIGSSAPVAGHTCMSYKARPWTPPLV
ncbi:unnamed protein product [Polarella glacialis]|uniref:Apple domain-containing protein n=1 Tax=Polarella glacialis TaxID=89957 RepID=A0A813LL96_POLGL|nr:unnamed protein product [Polarella glacialis]